MQLMQTAWQRILMMNLFEATLEGCVIVLKVAKVLYRYDAVKH